MAYRLEVADRAKRALYDLPAIVQERIVRSLARVAASPRLGPNVKKLGGMEDTYRLRVGDYRIVYRVFDDLLLVLVVKVGHQRDVYR